MNRETPDPPAPPPLAAWWGHTGLLYVALSVLGAVAGTTAALLVWERRPSQQGTPAISDMVMAFIQWASFYGAAIGVAQWLVLRRLVRRALHAVTGVDLSQAGRRLVRDTALWIVATVAGMVAGAAISGLVTGILIQVSAYGFLGLPASLVMGLIYGIALGSTQWLVLRRRIPQAGRWVWRTAGGMLLGHFVQALAWLVLFTPIPSAGSRLLDLWWPQAVSSAILTAVFAWMQSACLKRLAPGWMKRLHETAHKEGAVGRDRVPGSETGAGS